MVNLQDLPDDAKIEVAGYLRYRQARRVTKAGSSSLRLHHATQMAFRARIANRSTRFSAAPVDRSSSEFSLENVV